MNIPLVPPKYRDWIPVRQYSTVHWRCYQSLNGKIFLGIDGEIFDFHLSIGRVDIAVEQSHAKYERNRKAREKKREQWQSMRSTGSS